jgi:glyoxylase I family protein
MKIEHVALQVEDPAGMARWYVEHLGCTIARVGGAPAFMHFLRDGAGTSMLELYRNPRVAVPDYASMDPMLVHVAFVSTDPAADRDRLVAAGATVADDLVRTPAGDELVMLRDPWGVALQLARRAQPMHE